MAKTISEVCAEIQSLQNQVFQLQRQYTDSSSVFLALTVAWEALRFAWYAAHGDFVDAHSKLERVQVAIAWYLESCK